MKHLIKTLILILIPFISFSQSLGKSGGKTRIAPTTQIRKGTKPRQVLMTRASDSCLVYADLDTIIPNLTNYTPVTAANNLRKLADSTIVRGSDDPANAKGSEFNSDIYNFMNSYNDSWVGTTGYDNSVFSINPNGYLYSKGRSNSDIQGKWGGLVYNNNTGSLLFGNYSHAEINNNINSDGSLFLGSNNYAPGNHLLLGGLNNNIATNSGNGGFVGGYSNSGVVGHGSILSGYQCIGAVRSWNGGYQMNITNGSYDCIGFGQTSEIKNCANSAMFASQNSIIENSNNSGILGAVSGTIDQSSNSSFILGGAQSRIRNSSKSIIFTGDQQNIIENCFNSAIIGTGGFNECYGNQTFLAGNYNYATANSSEGHLIGNNNRAVWGQGGRAFGYNLRTTNAQMVALGNYNKQWANGQQNSHDANDLLLVIGGGFDLSSGYNTMTMKKDGSVQFATAAPTSTGVSFSQSYFEPKARFEVNTIDSNGDALGGVLLARMTSTQLSSIPSGALTDGLEIYCSDCTANDTSVGVKMVYQLSTTTWKKLW